MFDGDIGAERFRLTVPPLPLSDYRRMQGLLLGPVRGRAGRWRGIVAWLTIFAVVLAGVVLADWAGLSGVVVLGSVRLQSTWTISDARLLLAAAALVLVLAALLLAVGRWQHRTLIGRFHAASRTVNSPHELVLGEKGVLAISPVTRLSAPWSTITAHVGAKGTHFLVLDRLSALWIPESALPNLLERDALLAFLAEKVPRGS